jgi:hypothetical protein
MDGSSPAADEFASLQLWKAIPICFEDESLAPISRRPLHLKPTIRAYKHAFRALAVEPKKIKDSFWQATRLCATEIKDMYGHASMMCRSNGVAHSIHEDILIGGFLPEISQKRKNEAGAAVYRNVASEWEMWRELMFYRREFAGALSDDHDIVPRTVLSARLTKAMVDEFPNEVRKQTTGRKYHSLGKKHPNCLTTWFNILRAFDIELPAALTRHRIPQELNKDIREGKLDNVMAECDSIVIVKREEMDRAIDHYRKNGRPQPYRELALAA